jgi:hypothetical protein
MVLEIIRTITFTKTDKPLKKFNIGYFNVVWLSVLKIKRKIKL